MSVVYINELDAIAKTVEDKLVEIAGKPVPYALFIFRDGEAEHVTNSKNFDEIKAAINCIMVQWPEGKLQ